MENQSDNPATDSVHVKYSKPKKVPGRGSKQRRQEAYRVKQNAETDAIITAGIFARLKISDPTAVSSLPLAKEAHPAIIPVSFKCIPDYVDRVWDTMEAIGTRPFGVLNTLANKNIFKKGILILNEAKVCYAQRAHIDKPDEALPSKKLYNLEELEDFNNMASTLPLPIAVHLEAVGNCCEGNQIVTPLLAEIQGENAELSGAISFAPSQMLPLLQLLSTGVPVNQEVHQIALELDKLPGIEWEEFQGPVIP